MPSINAGKECPGDTGMGNHPQRKESHSLVTDAKSAVESLCSGKVRALYLKIVCFHEAGYLKAVQSSVRIIKLQHSLFTANN